MVNISDLSNLNDPHKVLAGNLDYLCNVDVNALGRSKELGNKFGFEDLIPQIKLAIKMAAQLRDQGVDSLPHKHTELLISDVSKVKDRIDEIREFSVDNLDDPRLARDFIIDTTKVDCENLRNSFMLPLAYTYIQMGDSGAIKTQIREASSEISHATGQFNKQMDEVRVESLSLLDEIRERAKAAGVSSHSELYSKQADSHKVSARWWFWATLLIVGVTLAAAAWGTWFTYNHPPKTTPESIQLVSSKVIILSLLSFSILWCSRNHKSHKHNETIYRNRANSMGTFQTFMSGTTDEATRNAILMFVAQSAFSQSATGYDKSEGGSDHPAQIVSPIVDIMSKQDKTN